MKSRGVYETPGGTLLLTARRAMESITLDRGEAHLKVCVGGVLFGGEQCAGFGGALWVVATGKEGLGQHLEEQTDTRQSTCSCACMRMVPRSQLGMWWWRQCCAVLCSPPPPPTPHPVFSPPHTHIHRTTSCPSMPS